MIKEFDEVHGIRLILKYGELVELLGKVIKNGYGRLPAVWAITLYLQRN